MEARARKQRSLSEHHRRRHHHHYEPQYSIGYKPTSHDFADRVRNALLHHLQLLYRSDPNFYVLGATGNVYSVNISMTPSCTCPDNVTPCKHILFILIKVLGVPIEDPILKKQTLDPSQIERLLSTPNSPDSLASHPLREKFHQALFLKKELGIRLKPCIEVEAGVTCPICSKDMGRKKDRIVACEKCKIPIHEECLMTNWKRSTTHEKKELTKCVTCRSHWKSDNNNNNQKERYLNLLSDYACEDYKKNFPKLAKPK